MHRDTAPGGMICTRRQQLLMQSYRNVLTLYVVLGDFSAHMGNDRGTWRRVMRRNVLPDLSLSGACITE